MGDDPRRAPNTPVSLGANLTRLGSTRLRFWPTGHRGRRHAHRTVGKRAFSKSHRTGLVNQCGRCSGRRTPRAAGAKQIVAPRHPCAIVLVANRGSVTDLNLQGPRVSVAFDGLSPRVSKPAKVDARGEIHR